MARRSRRARRLLVIVQLMWLAMALIDLLLALFLAKAGLGPVASPFWLSGFSS